MSVRASTETVSTGCESTCFRCAMGSSRRDETKIAQGGVRRSGRNPGSLPNNESRAPRRAARNSPPNIARVINDMVFLQERDELRLKTAPPMTFLLACDIRNCGARLRRPDGKCAVALLPLKVPLPLRLVHPERRCALNLSHCIRDWKRGRQREENVNVILCSPNGQGFETMLSRDTSDVRPKSRLNLLRDRPATFLRGEDTMKQRATIGV